MKCESMRLLIFTPTVECLSCYDKLFEVVSQFKLWRDAIVVAWTHSGFLHTVVTLLLCDYSVNVSSLVYVISTNEVSEA